MSEPTSNEAGRLHDLLTSAVPTDAPAVDPAQVAAAARRARTRSRRIIAGVCAAVVALGGLLAVLTTDLGDADRVASEEPPSPYDAPDCPTPPPSIGSGEPGGTTAGLLGEDAGLDDARSVRFCPDLSDPDSSAPLSTNELALIDATDALVTDIDDFATAIDEATPDYDAARCASMNFIVDDSVLQVELEDGRTALVATQVCGKVAIGGRDVDGSEVLRQFRRALDAQRDRLTSERPELLPSPDCLRTQVGVARPGREHLVAAVVCEHGRKTRLIATLDADELARLDRAWTRPEDLPPSHWDGEASCRTSALVEVHAITDRGDRVRLSVDCDYLVWHGWETRETAAVPITLADLGLTRP